MAAVASWGEGLASAHGEVLAVGYFGSLARGDWGVGSDADLVVLVHSSDARFEERASAFPADELPVPADVLVYTVEEWEEYVAASPFGRRLAEEVQWVARKCA